MAGGGCEQSGKPLTATLSGLRIGSLTLDPAFEAGITHYTANTANATNSITATPVEEGTTVKIMVNEQASEDGKPTWKAGANTVTVTATNKSVSTTYTVDVTKA